MGWLPLQILFIWNFILVLALTCFVSGDMNTFLRPRFKTLLNENSECLVHFKFFWPTSIAQETSSLFNKFHTNLLVTQNEFVQVLGISNAKEIKPDKEPLYSACRLVSNCCKIDILFQNISKVNKYTINAPFMPLPTITFLILSKSASLSLAEMENIRSHLKHTLTQNSFATYIIAFNQTIYEWIMGSTERPIVKVHTQPNITELVKRFFIHKKPKLNRYVLTVNTNSGESFNKQSFLRRLQTVSYNLNFTTQSVRLSKNVESTFFEVSSIHWDIGKEIFTKELVVMDATFNLERWGLLYVTEKHDGYNQVVFRMFNFKLWMGLSIMQTFIQISLFLSLVFIKHSTSECKNISKLFHASLLIWFRGKCYKMFLQKTTVKKWPHITFHLAIKVIWTWTITLLATSAFRGNLTSFLAKRPVPDYPTSVNDVLSSNYTSFGISNRHIVSNDLLPVQASFVGHDFIWSAQRPFIAVGLVQDLWKFKSAVSLLVRVKFVSPVILMHKPMVVNFFVVRDAYLGGHINWVIRKINEAGFVQNWESDLKLKENLNTKWFSKSLIRQVHEYKRVKELFSQWKRYCRIYCLTGIAERRQRARKKLTLLEIRFIWRMCPVGWTLSIIAFAFECGWKRFCKSFVVFIKS